ncbi:hypothetical protein HDU76_011355 [Blyttiomyces sp. JEL0837]|nr:hypothetical protein HDU76_011355 [Blyttiomyces sp. JEL0837]
MLLHCMAKAAIDFETGTFSCLEDPPFSPLNADNELTPGKITRLSQLPMLYNHIPTTSSFNNLYSRCQQKKTPQEETPNRKVSTSRRDEAMFRFDSSPNSNPNGEKSPFVGVWVPSNQAHDNGSADNDMVQMTANPNELFHGMRRSSIGVGLLSMNYGNHHEEATNTTNASCAAGTIDESYCTDDELDDSEMANAFMKMDEAVMDYQDSDIGSDNEDLVASHDEVAVPMSLDDIDLEMSSQYESHAPSNVIAHGTGGDVNDIVGNFANPWPVSPRYSSPSFKPSGYQVSDTRFVHLHNNNRHGLHQERSNLPHLQNVNYQLPQRRRSRPLYSQLQEPTSSSPHHMTSNTLWDIDQAQNHRHSLLHFKNSVNEMSSDAEGSDYISPSRKIRSNHPSPPSMRAESEDPMMAKDSLFEPDVTQQEEINVNATNEMIIGNPSNHKAGNGGVVFRKVADKSSSQGGQIDVGIARNNVQKQQAAVVPSNAVNYERNMDIAVAAVVAEALDKAFEDTVQQPQSRSTTGITKNDVVQDKDMRSVKRRGRPPKQLMDAGAIELPPSSTGNSNTSISGLPRSLHPHSKAATGDNPLSNSKSLQENQLIVKLSSIPDKYTPPSDAQSSKTLSTRESTTINWSHIDDDADFGDEGGQKVAADERTDQEPSNLNKPVPSAAPSFVELASPVGSLGKRKTMNSISASYNAIMTSGTSDASPLDVSISVASVIEPAKKSVVAATSTSVATTTSRSRSRSRSQSTGPDTSAASSTESSIAKNRRKLQNLYESAIQVVSESKKRRMIEGRGDMVEGARAGEKVEGNAVNKERLAGAGTGSTAVKGSTSSSSKQSNADTHRSSNKKHKAASGTQSNVQAAGTGSTTSASTSKATAPSTKSRSSKLDVAVNEASNGPSKQRGIDTVKPSTSLNGSKDNAADESAPITTTKKSNIKSTPGINAAAALHSISTTGSTSTSSTAAPQKVGPRKAGATATKLTQRKPVAKESGDRGSQSSDKSVAETNSTMDDDVVDDGDDNDLDDDMDEDFAPKTRRNSSSSSRKPTRTSIKKIGSSVSKSTSHSRGSNNRRRSNVKQDDDEEENVAQPKLTRRERNRIAAQKSREKRSQLMQDLVIENEELRKEIEELKKMVAVARKG